MSTKVRRQRGPAPIAFIGLPLGILFLSIGLNRPSIAGMRTIDLIHLLATGACLGAGLGGLVLYLVGRRRAGAADASPGDSAGGGHVDD